ncbi:MAG TPA: ComF family protein [Bacillota bacterium]|nr:ComF family protein [Bacillota bacterium]
MTCLWCDQPINESIHWGNVFWPSKRKEICTSCEEKLPFIEGQTCHRCGRNSFEAECKDCQWWEKQLKDDPLRKNISIFSYNDFMKEIIAQWKYRGDYVLIEMFRHYFAKKFAKHFQTIVNNAIIVPIPLSEERLMERRFNQAEALTTLLHERKNVVTHLLYRRHSEKQAKKTRQERIQSNNPFMINSSVKKRVILIDDIYTTGMTLRHAAMVLKARGCPEVFSFTLVRG